MTGVLLVTHGNLAESLLQTAAMILGAPQGVVAIGFQPGEGRDTLETRIKEALQMLDTGDGIVILTDVMGGSPFQAGVLARGERDFRVLAGVNLPMLIECLMGREGKTQKDMEVWTKEIQRAGKKGIQEV